MVSRKNKTRRMSEGGPWGSSPYAFSKQDWIQKGMHYLKVSRGGFRRGFLVMSAIRV